MFGRTPAGQRCTRDSTVATEALESRRLFASAIATLSSGVLTVTGTSAADSLYITYQVAGD